MATRLFFLLSAALALLGASPPDPTTGSRSESKPQILIPGEYWREDITTGAEGGWYALALAESGIALIPVHVRFELLPQLSWSDVPGVKVSARESAEPLFLLRDLPGLRAGPVETWFRGLTRLSPGDSLPMTQPRGQRYRIVAGSPVPLKKGVAGHPLFRYDLRIEDRQTHSRQRLGTWLVDQGPAIQWVGDLDRDGKVDLFVRDSVETGEATWTLLLSSWAARSQIVGGVASFHRTGC